MKTLAVICLFVGVVCQSNIVLGADLVYQCNVTVTYEGKYKKLGTKEFSSKENSSFTMMIIANALELSCRSGGHESDATQCTFSDPSAGRHQTLAFAFAPQGVRTLGLAVRYQAAQYWVRCDEKH